MEKVQLPETGFFYELAMRRSAEIKGVTIQPTKKARPPVSDVKPPLNFTAAQWRFFCEIADEQRTYCVSKYKPWIALYSARLIDARSLDGCTIHGLHLTEEGKKLLERERRST